MKRNENYINYDDERRPIPWGRLFLSLFGILLIIILVLCFLKFCGKRPLDETLLKAGKDYYQKYPSKLPEEVGQCYTVSLKQLMDENLIDAKDYDDCNTENTYVKVCYLESKNYHYVAILSCDSAKTKFGMWTDGTEKDIVADKSDVRFRYIGERLNLGTKYYFPNANTDVKSVKEYYVTSPNEEYTEKEDEQTGYKWYTNTASKTYYNNGEYRSTQPSGYPNKGESKTVTAYSLTKPSTYSYRVIEDTTLYRTKQEARQYKWECTSTENTNLVMISQTICGARDDEFKIMTNAYYTCDGKTDVSVGTSCGDFTDWTTEACKASTLNGIVCESKTGYKYTDTQWTWYKSSNSRSYYPSGSASADKEKTYYVEAPVSGAIKDESTAKTVYKYYKLSQDTENANVKEWVDVTGGYVSANDMFTSFQKLGYDVKSLSDIDKMEDIRYQLQLQYRNVEE